MTTENREEPAAMTAPTPERPPVSRARMILAPINLAGICWGLWHIAGAVLPDHFDLGDFISGAIATVIGVPLFLLVVGFLFFGIAGHRG